MKIVVCAVLVAAVAAVAAPSTQADDPALSPGCNMLNLPMWDAGILPAELLPQVFAAGERMIVTVGNPEAVPSLLGLRIDGVVVATTTLPGSVQYIFPAAGEYQVHWFFITSGAVEFLRVACDRPAPPEQMTADLRSAIGPLALASGTTTALTSKLDAALAALAAGDRASACGSMNAFLNAVDAQTGKKILETQAAQLIPSAQAIRAALNC